MISSTIKRPVAAALLAVGAVLPAAAQVGGNSAVRATGPFLGGVPQGSVSSEPIFISLADAIHRALDHNLGVLQAEDNLDRARGSRRVALSELLPHLNVSLTESRRTTNLEAFGFPLRGQFPALVGPYNVFDARVFVTQAVVDRSAAKENTAQSHSLAAARHEYRGARDLVVLVSANLYLQALASAARVDTTRAQLDTAQALYAQAQDLRQNGLVAGIDVIRAEVRLSSDRQRATAANNDLQRAKLQLARVIGLPIGQEFTMSAELPAAVPYPETSFDEALQDAYRGRPEYLAALERVKAAELSLQAVQSDRLPDVRLNGDYGAIGLTPGTALSTFNITAAVTLPLFEGGRREGRALQADADLKRRRTEAEDMRASVYYDVRSAFLDLQATREQLETATRARDLAAQQLVQSRDRFAAGVANNVEVIQAQEAVTLANEQYIEALYGFNVAKALLARSLGNGEETVQKILGAESK